VKGTRWLGVTGIGLTAGVAGLEWWHVWKRGRAPLPAETDHVVEAGLEAGRETVEVTVAGYRFGDPKENALLNLLLSYALTFAVVRASTHTIRERGSFGPIRNLHINDRHIHHFIPGIIIAFLAGGVSVVSRDEGLDQWLAIPFGIGTALTLDEAALLIELEDVYWSEEGILSVQIALAGLTGLGALAMALRLFRRGEQAVLGA
jgi:hypothetical protein